MPDPQPIGIAAVLASIGLATYDNTYDSVGDASGWHATVCALASPLAATLSGGRGPVRPHPAPDGRDIADPPYPNSWHAPAPLLRPSKFWIPDFCLQPEVAWYMVAAPHSPRYRHMPHATPAPATPALAVSIPDAARLIGTSRSTIYRMASEGAIQMRKLGSHTVILRADLDALVSGLPVAAVRVKRAP